jgi:hypothetical protein
MLEGPRTGGIELPAPPARALAIEAGPSTQRPASPAVRDARSVAADAEGCTDTRALTVLGREARRLELMDEFVTSRYADGDEMIELVEVFRARQAELEGSGR